MNSSHTDHLKAQYEKYPYPPLPFFALPKKNQGLSLRYETGSQQKPHEGIRILVAGAGTFEALLVGILHPQADEVLAVDFSKHSLNILKKRLSFYKLSHFYQKLPAIRLIEADLSDFLESSEENSESFDYIIASNVIHHVSDPARLLSLFSKSLRQNGILRLVTYPKASRIWMRQTSQFFKSLGISPETPKLKQKCLAALKALPPEHPICFCFMSQPEIHRRAGVVDAFLNALENPLHPFEWAKASTQCGLSFFQESQRETSQSRFLDEIVPELSGLHPWSKLQILDDLLELCANPILWFRKTAKPTSENIPSKNIPEELFKLKKTPSQLNPQAELNWNFSRIQALLQDSPVSAEKVIKRFKEEVGPRVLPPRDIPMPGLALSDYDLGILKANQV